MISLPEMAHQSMVKQDPNVEEDRREFQLQHSPQAKKSKGIWSELATYSIVENSRAWCFIMGKLVERSLLQLATVCVFLRSSANIEFISRVARAGRGKTFGHGCPQVGCKTRPNLLLLNAKRFDAHDGGFLLFASGIMKFDPMLPSL